MSRSRVGSLGRRLSTWLALQSLAGLSVVCVAVYAVTHVNLEARQIEALTQKQTQVRHLLTEEPQRGDASTLTHKLDDFFVGHQDLALSLARPDGSVFYQRAVGESSPGSARVASFEVAAPATAPDKLTAVLTLDTGDDRQLLRRLALTLLAAALGGAALVSVGGFVLVRLGLRPVRELVEQTRLLAADTLHRRLDGSGQAEELEPLIAQFNELLGRLSQAYEQLEGFNADVAHELCTPLATLISSTELALRRARGGEELREVLGSNLEELQRVAGIVQDMLFLSQADRGSSARRVATASLAGVARQVADYHDAALDDAGFREVLIMSYSTKFASALYGPFREAAASGFSFGDRSTYQIHCGNSREAILESQMDADEGADILMVKPAGFYLDILAGVAELGLPVAAYQVSGEYSMIKSAAERGWLKEKETVLESLTCIKRAGADLIITYFAADVAGWLDEKQ